MRVMDRSKETAPGINSYSISYIYKAGIPKPIDSLGVCEHSSSNLPPSKEGTRMEGSFWTPYEIGKSARTLCRPSESTDFRKDAGTTQRVEAHGTTTLHSSVHLAHNIPIRGPQAHEMDRRSREVHSPTSPNGGTSRHERLERGSKGNKRRSKSHHITQHVGQPDQKSMCTRQESSNNEILLRKDLTPTRPTTIPTLLPEGCEPNVGTLWLSKASHPGPISPPTRSAETYPLPRHLPERPLLERPEGTKPDSTPTCSTVPSQPYFSFDDAVRLSGLVREGPFAITGYKITDDGKAIPTTTETLKKAKEAMATALQDVDLKFKGQIDLGGIVVKLLPGGSSDEPKIAIFKDGKWTTIESYKAKCTSALAPVSSHHLNASKLRTRAKLANDSELVKMIDVFLNGSDTQNKLDLVGKEKIGKVVSRDFDKKDIDMLEKAQIISKVCNPRGNTHALKNFKVPKKLPTEARLITDCRPINEQINLFEDQRMEIPSLHDIMDWALQHQHILSIDANAYFFQFKLVGPTRSWFPLRIATTRGPFQDFVLNRLPMGFKLAPVIAQRSSNVIVKMTKERMLEQNIPGEVAAWVDNFLVFANTSKEAEFIMRLVEKELEMIEIKCKEVDTSGEFVGMALSEEGIRLLTPFREKLKEQLRSTIMAPTAEKLCC